MIDRRRRKQKTEVFKVMNYVSFFQYLLGGGGGGEEISNRITKRGGGRGDNWGDDTP